MSKRSLGLLLLGIWLCGGVAHAAISVTDATVDVGTVIVNQSQSGSTTISADVNTPNVTVVTHGGDQCGEFSIVTPTGTITLNNGNTATVTVKLTPTSRGGKSCVIDIKQGPNIAQHFTVTGQAVAPGITPQAPTFPDTDVGQTSAGQTLTVTNNGDSDLTITSAALTAASTDFTATLVSPSPLVPIAPQGQATWSITCHPSTFGPRTGTFDIASDALGAATLHVPLTCLGRQGVLKTDQTTTINFTAVPRGTTQTRTFKLSNIGNVDVGAIAITVTPANVGYTVDPSTLTTLVATTGNATITVSFKPMAKTDGGPATIHFAGTWGNAATAIPPLSLDVDGKESSFAVDPAQPALDFGKFRYDTHPRKMFQLVNDGATTLTMAAPFTPDAGTMATEYQVELANGTLTMTPPVTLNTDAQLTVVVTPQVAHRIGVVSGHIDITPSLGAPLRVPITGVATAAEIAFPDTVSFGLVDLNDPPVMRTVTIENTSDNPLSITSFSATDPISGGAPSTAFQIDLPSTPRQINGGEKLSFAVTYQPTVATNGGSDTVRVNAQLVGALNVGLSIQVTGEAAFFRAHGSGGCDAGGAGRGGGLAIGLAALIVVLRRRRRAPRGAAARGAIAVLAAAAATLTLGPAAARADGIGLSVFAPTPATAGEGFALQSPEVGTSGSWVASAVVSYASNPLILDGPTASGGRASSTLVSRSTLMQIGLAYALLGRLELGAHLPLYQQSGTSEMPDQPLKSTATGNLAFHLKARILRAAGGPGVFALGASALVAVPTATRNQFTGGDQPEGRLMALAAFSPAVLDSRFTISVNAGRALRRASRFKSFVQGGSYAWGGGLSIRILDELWATGELYGEVTPLGEVQERRGGAMPPPSTLSAIEGLAGFTIKPDRRVSVGLAVGRGVNDAIGTPDLRGVLSVSIVPGAAPLAPIHPIVPDGDADGDGIPDSVDQCPHDPEDKDGFEDADGCPDPDNDRDGIPDAQDKCPLDPEDKDGFEDADGCPDPDNDHDGIPDKLDKCPNEPEDKDGFEDLDGCPDPDNDHDGIPDEKDKCPNEPETINGFQDDDGCPDKGDTSIILSPDKIETLDPIQFTGVKLARGATPLIAQIGATLRAHPEILRVRITVHVQPTSDPDADQARTDKRAQAVRDWLVQWGVAPARVEARGFGGTKPLVPPEQRGAAKLNERIEFIILERK